MTNTIELEDYLSMLIPDQESAEFLKSLYLPISKEYMILMTHKEYRAKTNDLLHTKEHFGKLYYIYLMDRDPNEFDPRPQPLVDTLFI
ncbi:MAG: hypothetical protein IE909_11955 [Campylobacterales bacterium]|nr:hypothetical protein [Campylobacterales bacterium]